MTKFLKMNILNNDEAEHFQNIQDSVEKNKFKIVLESIEKQSSHLIFYACIIIFIILIVIFISKCTLAIIKYRLKKRIYQRVAQPTHNNSRSISLPDLRVASTTV